MSLLFAVLSFIAAFLLTAVLNWLALIPWRRSAGAHWTERARRLYPVRVSALLHPWLYAANAAVAMQLVRGEATRLWLPSALAAWLGAAMGGYLVDRQIWPNVSFKDWAGQFTLYALFFQAGLLLVGAAFLVMPPYFGWQTWVIAGGLLTIQLSLILGVTLKILQWTKLLQPAPVRLREIATCATERAGAKLRAVWVNPGPLANAFALLPMNDLLFSRRLLEIASDAELESICSHEAAHLTESKWIFGARVLGALTLYPLIFFIPVSYRFGLAGVGLLLVGSVALFLLPRRLARRMEKRADAAAADQTTDPAVYARALEKLYETNLMPAVMPKRSRMIHPDLYDRMIAADTTPTYERPRPPSKSSWTTLLLAFGLGLQIVTLASIPKVSDKAGTDESSPEPMRLMVLEPRNAAEGVIPNPPSH